MTALSIGQRSLIQQGYDNYSRQELDNISNSLRITPTVALVIVIIGISSQLPEFLFISAIISFIATVVKKGHLYDLLFNSLIAPLINAKPLPPSPLLRRASYFTDGLLQIALAISLSAEEPIGLFLLSTLHLFSSFVLISSHFNASAWLIQYGFTHFGIWKKPMSVRLAKQFITNGALLVDIRNSEEYQKDHLPGAINVPLNKIKNHILLNNKNIILYCKNGTSCKKAKEHLEYHTNIGDVHIFGAMCRWE